MYLTTNEARELAAVCVSSRSTVDGYGPAYDQLVRALRPNLEHDSEVKALFKHVRFEKRDYIEYLCMRHPKTAHKHLVRPLMLPPSLRMPVDPTEVSVSARSAAARARAASAPATFARDACDSVAAFVRAYWPPPLSPRLTPQVTRVDFFIDLFWRGELMLSVPLFVYVDHDGNLSEDRRTSGDGDGDGDYQASDLDVEDQDIIATGSWDVSDRKS